MPPLFRGPRAYCWREGRGVGTRGPPLAPPLSAAVAEGGDGSGAPVGNDESACRDEALALIVSLSFHVAEMKFT